TFQRGVRKYLNTHAHGVASTKDFIAALANEAAHPSWGTAADVASVLSSFLDQTGAPLVGVELQCAKDAAPKLALTQQRFTTIGSTVSTEQTWHVPVCVKFGSDKLEGRACTVLSQATGTLELPTKQCPKWVLANAGELGYYR